GHLPDATLAVTDDQGVALGVAFVTVRRQVRGDLGLQGGHEHPAGSLTRDLVEDGAPFPPRATKRRAIRREDTPPGSRAPRSTTSDHTSAICPPWVLCHE